MAPPVDLSHLEGPLRFYTVHVSDSDTPDYLQLVHRDGGPTLRIRYSTYRHRVKLLGRRRDGSAADAGLRGQLPVLLQALTELLPELCWVCGKAFDVSGGACEQCRAMQIRDLIELAGLERQP
jgi:hypothetical protein